jgi:hypothetical protein
MRGTVEECLKAFKKTGSTEALTAAYVARYPDSRAETVERWLRQQVLPIGRRLIQLQCFLAERDFRVTFKVELHPAVVELRRMLAEGLLTVEEVTEGIGYNAPSQTYQVLLGNQYPSPTYQNKLVAYAASFSGVLEPAQPAAPVADEQVPIPVEAIKKALVAGISGLAPLVAIALSDAFTAEDRDDIREAAGNDGVFNLKNALARLCGERARSSL